MKLSDAGMDFSKKQVVEADTISAHSSENPKRVGLQALSRVKTEALLEYLDGKLVESERVNIWLTSMQLALIATKDLRAQGVRIRVDNLMIKSALHLLGFEAVTPSVLIRHYRIAFRRGMFKEVD